VRISREGYVDYQSQIELKNGETATMSVPPLRVETPDASEVGQVAPSVAPNPPQTGLVAASDLRTGGGEPYAVKDAFHIVGISALRRNNKFDLSVTSKDMQFFSKDKRVYRIPFERTLRVQMISAERYYAKATYAAVLAAGAIGALMLAKKRKVDALVIDYENEKGGLMQMVIQVPKGMGTPCLDRLAHGGVAIGPPEA
jgi:hypothetical protein